MVRSIVSLGARCEYRYSPEPPRTGAESAAAGDPALDEYLHLSLMNRGVLITPVHNMALMCPATTDEQVEALGQIFTGKRGGMPWEILGPTAVVAGLVRGAITGSRRLGVSTAEAARAVVTVAIEEVHRIGAVAIAPSLNVGT